MPKENLELDNIRHSLAHLLAAAVLKEFPDAKLGIGPTIDNGFYYDFELSRTLTPDDLKMFEKTMRKLIGQKLPFTGKPVTASEAKEIFKSQPFKTELIEEFAKDGKELTIYETGDVFMDLCRGGHVENTSEIPADAFTLDKIAGAYWRGDEKNPQLQRIYGLAFESKKELDDYLKMREEAKKRDHRVLGKQLKLFTISELIGRRTSAHPAERHDHPQGDRGLSLGTPRRQRIFPRMDAAHRERSALCYVRSRRQIRR